jgi:hypothetical protein
MIDRESFLHRKVLDFVVGQWLFFLCVVFVRGRARPPLARGRDQIEERDVVVVVLSGALIKEEE